MLGKLKYSPGLDFICVAIWGKISAGLVRSSVWLGFFLFKK